VSTGAKTNITETSLPTDTGAETNTGAEEIVQNTPPPVDAGKTENTVSQKDQILSHFTSSKVIQN